MTDLERKAILDYLRGNEFFGGIKDPEKKLNAWIDAYPVDIFSELKKMNAWLVSKGARYKDYGRFVNGWLSTASGPPAARPASVNEILAKITASLDIKGGLKTQKIDEQARIRELKEQAERYLRRP